MSPALSSGLLQPGTSNNAANTYSSGGGGMVKAATLIEIWEDLKSGIESVYSQQTMSKPRYMSLYS